jgi:hypothetical protein
MVQEAAHDGVDVALEVLIMEHLGEGIGVKKRSEIGLTGSNPSPKGPNQVPNTAPLGSRLCSRRLRKGDGRRNLLMKRNVFLSGLEVVARDDN